MVQINSWGKSKLCFWTSQQAKWTKKLTLRPREREGKEVLFNWCERSAISLSSSMLLLFLEAFALNLKFKCQLQESFDFMVEFKDWEAPEIALPVPLLGDDPDDEPSFPVKKHVQHHTITFRVEGAYVHFAVAQLSCNHSSFLLSYSYIYFTA